MSIPIPLDPGIHICRMPPRQVCKRSAWLSVENRQVLTYSFSIQEPQEAETAAASARAAAPRVAPRSAAVNLSGQQLTCVPAELWDSAACLTHLDLSNNQLSDLLAERLAGCAQLKVRTAAPTSNTFHASEVPMPDHIELSSESLMWLGYESFKWGGNRLFASHALACKGVPEQGAEADQEPPERPLITEST